MQSHHSQHEELEWLDCECVSMMDVAEIASVLINIADRCGNHQVVKRSLRDANGSRVSWRC
jgi:hypothetical protein